MNKKIYFWTIAISILLLIPYCKWDHSFLSIISSIGCSGIAAAIMAIFLETAAENRERERNAKARSIFFKGLSDELKTTLERILWFDSRIEDNEFDWSKEPASYYTVNFLAFAWKNYQTYTLSKEEAERRLEELEEKYSIEKVRNFTQEKREKVDKMFTIIFASCKFLVSELNSAFSNKIELDKEDYISLEEAKQLESNIKLALTIFGSRGANYGVAISHLLTSYRTLCRIGQYSDNYDVSISIKLGFLGP